MKTKIRLRQGGVKNHPLWHIVVQGEKKNLRGKYIEKIGYWMPRQQKTYKRGIVLNKHKMRYWLSVGAEPTGGVIRLLNKYDFYPNRPTPHGSASVYEKPEKVYSMQGWKMKGKPKDNAIHYQQLLQGQMNIIERQRRVQAEAMANLGLDNQMDLELVRTDDIDSEEGDIYERVKKFEELQKRFSKHRKEQQQLKGNDLRYNVYLNKIHKLTRMDLGLDVEGYKDYVHNLKMFAKYNEDYQIFANDQLYPERGTTHDPSLGARLPGNPTTPHPSQPNFDAEGVDYRKINQRDAELFNKLRNTVGKIHREHQSVITQEDRDNIEDFAERTDHYLNYDYELALDIKHLYDKRIIEQKERKEMGMVHIAQVTDADLEACGVSKREFALIRKLLDLDNDIFAYRDHREESAFYYAVDLSKYDQKKIPKDCKEMMYRPNKMRRLYERYWQVASHLDKKARETLEMQKAKRYYPRKLAKTEAQYELMDRMVEIVDNAVAGFEKEQKDVLRAATGQANPKMANLKLVTALQKRIILQAKGQDPDTPPKLYFKDQFQYEAEKVLQLIRVNGEATKSQLQYLIMYNEVMATDRKYYLEKEQRSKLRIWEPVEHKEVEVQEYAIGQLKERVQSDGSTDQEGRMSGEERQSQSEEESSTTDGDGLTKHRMENVTAMTPEEYLRYKRGIKEEIYGPAKREDGVIGLHNIGESENEIDIRDMDPNAVTYDQLHGQALLGRDVAELEDQVEDLEDFAQPNVEDSEEFQLRGEREDHLEQQADEELDRYAHKMGMADVYMEERLGDAIQEMQEALPAELMQKFELLQEFDFLSFEEQSECLSYFVDKMKSDVITSLVDKSDALEKMDEQGRKEFYLTLDDLVNQCSNQLFHIHQQQADREQGKLTKDSEDFKITVQNLQVLFDQIDLIESQYEQLQALRDEREDLVDQGLRPLGEEFDYHDQFRTIQEIRPNLNAPEDYNEKYDPNMKYVQMPTDMDKLPHWKELHHTEAAEILDRLSYNLSNEIKNKEDAHDQKMDLMLDRMYLTSRYQLDYAKLFHGHEGGYPVEKLRTILARIRSDQEDMLHPFLDPKADEELDDALEILAMKRLYKRTGYEGFKIETSTDEENEFSAMKSTQRQNSSDEEADHIVSDQEAVNEDEEVDAPAQEGEGEETAVPEPTIGRIQWLDKWDDEDYEPTPEDYRLQMMYETQTIDDYMLEVTNEDGTIDQDKLAEKVKMAKELDVKDFSATSSGGEELFEEIRNDFIEEAERERDDEEVNEDELPDPVGLNKFQKSILDEVEDPAEQLIIKEVLLMLAEKQEDELVDDYFGGESSEEQEVQQEGEEDPEMTKRLRGGLTKAEQAHQDKVLDALEQRYKLEYGYELHDITDEEEFKTAYVEYVKKAVLKKKKQKYKKSMEDIEHDKMMRDDAIYKQLFELMQGADMPISLVSGEFQPNKYGRIKEMQRIESNVGRYPMGYRHYENYHNYKLLKPDATITDYQTDVNSPISFDEFFELKKRSFIYECNYNPMVYYENGFDDLDPDDEEDRKKMPENIAEQEDFRQDAQELFMQRTHQLLMEKKHFTKVEALEMFTNFWSFGRGVNYFPTHNIYVPVTETIMPRPKFRDMNKWDDQEGKDWTYRTRDSHAPQRAFNMPNTIKPAPMSPAPPKMDLVTPWLAADPQHRRFKWNKYRRISKSRRDSHTSINMPVKWKSFSTSTRNSMTEDQEQKLIQDFNTLNPLRPSVFDKSTYNPFKVFANHFFNK